MTDTSLLQEIDEDVRRRKIEALWRAHGRRVIAGAVLLVLATAAWSAWSHWTKTRQEASTGALMAVVLGKDSAQPPAAREAALAHIAATWPGSSPATMARFAQAELVLKAGRRDEAVALYDGLATDSRVEPLFRQLASFLSTQAQMDTGDPAQLLARLEPLQTADGAWRYSAQDLAAFLALKAGDRAKAEKLFTGLAQATDAPEAIVRRATDMLRWLKEGA